MREKGLSTADGEIATYTAQDLGFTNETGYTTYLGIQIFTANTTGKMAKLDAINIVNAIDFVHRILCIECMFRMSMH